MKKNTSYIVVALVAVIAVGAWWALNSPKKEGNPTPQELYAFDTEKCPGQTVQMSMTDVYLRGILERGEKFSALINWYRCNSIERGDLVLYRFAHDRDPVVRKIYGVPGDKIVVDFHKGLKAWTLKINDEEVQATDGPYFFGGEVPPPLANYAKDHDGTLQPGDVILLSSFPPGSEDSSIFGAIALVDIIAKVEKGVTQQ